MPVCYHVVELGLDLVLSVVHATCNPNRIPSVIAEIWVGDMKFRPSRWVCGICREPFWVPRKKQVPPKSGPEPSLPISGPEPPRPSESADPPPAPEAGNHPPNSGDGMALFTPIPPPPKQPSKKKSKASQTNSHGGGSRRASKGVIVLRYHKRLMAVHPSCWYQNLSERFEIIRVFSEGVATNCCFCTPMSAAATTT